MRRDGALFESDFFFFFGKFIKYELCASNIYNDHLNLWIDKT